MYGLPNDCFKKFCRETYKMPDSSMRIDTKIDQLLPDFFLDDQAFDPYGYSVNGIKEDTYFTIHVTPQESCSYASFETNLASPELSKVLMRVLDIFKPANFCLAVVYNVGIQKTAESVVSCLHQQFNFKTVETRNISSYTTCYAWL
ncbi:hypothetical protein MXB_3226 [Myxobolus squamalis]|nr:hypothetical protein MXB_3226 [Myxobolus squamalis]